MYKCGLTVNDIGIPCLIFNEIETVEFPVYSLHYGVFRCNQ